MNERAFQIARNVLHLLIVILAIAFQSSYAQAPEPQTDREYYENFDDCSEYNEDDINDELPDRVFLESQSSWLPYAGQDLGNVELDTSESDDFGHIRVGTCFPINQEFTGPVPFKLRIIFHNYPFGDEGDATFDYVSPHIFGSGSTRRISNLVTGSDRAITDADITGNNNQIIRVGGATNGVGTRKIAEICNAADQDPNLEDTCIIGFEFDVNTEDHNTDGLHEIRFFVSVNEPDGQQNHVSTGWPIILRNGGPDRTTQHRPPPDRADEYEIQGRGWYTGLNYAVGTIYDFDPLQPVDETWAPKIESSKAPTLGASVNYTVLHLDPDFDNDDAGVVLLRSTPEDPDNPEPPLRLNLPALSGSETMTLGEMLDAAIAPVDRFDPKYSRTFENGQLREGEHKLAIRTISACNLTDDSKTNDCDCAFNANAAIRTMKDGNGNDVPRTHRYRFDGNDVRLLQDGINADGSCMHKDPAFYVFTQGDTGITVTAPLLDDVGNPINNHAQSTTSILTIPFIFASSDQPSLPQTSMLSVRPVEVVEIGSGGADIGVDVIVDISPPLPAGSTATFRLQSRFAQNPIGGAERALSADRFVNGVLDDTQDYHLRNSPVITIPSGSSSVTMRFDNLVINNDDVTPGDEQFSLRVIGPSSNVVAGADGLVTITDSVDDVAIVCGDPDFSATDTAGVYLWQDCPEMGGVWHLRIAGGGQSYTRYNGNIASDQTFGNLTPVSVEANDSVELSTNSQSIVYNLSAAGSGHDGFDFELPSGNSCLTVSEPSNARIFVGIDRLEMTTSQFDILSLQACQ